MERTQQVAWLAAPRSSAAGGVGSPASTTPDPQVGLLGPLQRAADALGLDGVGGFAQPGGVGDPDWEAGQHQADLDHVARGARQCR